MRGSRAGAAVAVSILLAAVLSGCKVSNPWTKADRLFKEEKYAEAAEAYSEAMEKHPGRTEPLFNRGAAQYMAEQLDASIETFQDVARGVGGDLQQRAEFNTGNSYLHKGDNQKAIEHYKRALYLRADDINAKWNLELAQRKPQQKQQQQQQKPDDEQQDEKQEPKQNQQDEQDKAQPEQPQGPQLRDGRPQPDERELSQKEAERLLRALAEQDRELQKSLRKPTEPVRVTPNGKDW